MRFGKSTCEVIAGLIGECAEHLAIICVFPCTLREPGDFALRRSLAILG
jgi:hypothetical protein